MSQEEFKKLAAEEALKYIEEDSVVGVGTGTTTNYFINALASIKHKIEGAVASSIATEMELKKQGIPVLDLNSAPQISVYVDGADEAIESGYLIKGGGGAMTREKIVATVAKKFICIMDESKLVNRLGAEHPIPVEVIPMARSFIGRELVKIGANPAYRENFTTDNGNIIIDAYDLMINEPLALETNLNNMPGVVGNGIFASRRADMLIIAGKEGIRTVG